MYKQTSVIDPVVVVSPLAGTEYTNALSPVHVWQTTADHRYIHI